MRKILLGANLIVGNVGSIIGANESYITKRRIGEKVTVFFALPAEQSVTLGLKVSAGVSGLVSISSTLRKGSGACIAFEDKMNQFDIDTTLLLAGVADGALFEVTTHQVGVDVSIVAVEKYDRALGQTLTALLNPKLPIDGGTNLWPILASTQGIKRGYLEAKMKQTAAYHPVPTQMAASELRSIVHTEQVEA